MIAANAPSPVVLAWGANAGVGYIRTVPVPSQISGGQAGAASWNDGFVPLNMTPVNAGGVPPFGQDINGALNVISAGLSFLQAGYIAPYNSAIAGGTAGGYPAKAVIPSIAGNGALWQSTADNNTANPDIGGAGWIMASSALIGSTRNLVGQLTGGTASKTATWTIDQICAGTGLGGGGFLGSRLILTFNGTVAGAGGMDTGSFPVGTTPIHVYAIYNPITNQWNTLGTISGSGATTYPGSSMPAGFIASCLLFSDVPSGSNFQNFYQQDRTIFVASRAVLTGLSGTSTSSFFNINIGTIVPPNAKALLSLNVNTSGGGAIVLSANGNGNLGYQTFNGSSNASSNLGNIPLLTPQVVTYAINGTGYSVSVDSFSI